MKRISLTFILLAITFSITCAQNQKYSLSKQEITELNEAIENNSLTSIVAQRFDSDELLNLYKVYKKNCYAADSLWRGDMSTLNMFENLGVTEKFELIPLSEYLVLSDSLTGESGVSYLIKTDDATILFDVGLNKEKKHPSPLLHNMEKLGISPEDIDIIVISHNHSDHVGGRDWTQRNTFSLTNYQMNLDDIKVYTPCEMDYPGLSPVYSTKPVKISEGVATTGVIHNPCFFMDIAEQSLAVNVKNKGIVILSGCGHHSVPKILARAKILFDEPVYGIFGGLHYPVEAGRNITPMHKLAIRMLPWEDFTIENVKKNIELLKENNIKVAGLSAHDSCDKSISAFKHEFGDDYYDIKVGQKISLR